MMEQPFVPPSTVRLAIKLLYGVLCLAAVRMIWTVFSHIEVRSPDLIILNAMVIYAVFTFLVIKLKHRKNWARIGILAIFAVSIPLAVVPIFQSLSHSPVVNGMGLVQLIIYLLALIQLFREDSSNWFRER